MSSILTEVKLIREKSISLSDKVDLLEKNKLKVATLLCLEGQIDIASEFLDLNEFFDLSDEQKIELLSIPSFCNIFSKLVIKKEDFRFYRVLIENNSLIDSDEFSGYIKASLNREVKSNRLDRNFLIRNKFDLLFMKFGFFLDKRFSPEELIEISSFIVESDLHGYIFDSLPLDIKLAVILNLSPENQIKQIISKTEKDLSFFKISNLLLFTPKNSIGLTVSRLMIASLNGISFKGLVV